jgi:hypothetical protein
VEKEEVAIVDGQMEVEIVAIMMGLHVILFVAVAREKEVSNLKNLNRIRSLILH